MEGVFRLSCEAVLTGLRRNRRALALLMEAILLDPLVDWVPNREDAAANQARTLQSDTPDLHALTAAALCLTHSKALHCNGEVLAPDRLLLVSCP